MKKLPTTMYNRNYGVVGYDYESSYKSIKLITTEKNVTLKT